LIRRRGRESQPRFKKDARRGTKASLGSKREKGVGREGEEERRRRRRRRRERRRKSRVCCEEKRAG
jgi:hypothetical protein